MLRKWLEFFQSSKEEKYIKISRVLYSALHKKEFAALGRHSLIIKPVIILNRKYMHIGRDVSIWNGARIECISTWNGKNITPPPALYIGDGCGIGQNLHLTCAGVINIEEYVNIAPHVLITDINHSYNELSESPLVKDLEIKNVKIGKFSFIGHGAKIMPGVQIGRNVIVGAGSVVSQNIESYSIAAGVPAKVIRKYNFESNVWEKT